MRGKRTVIESGSLVDCDGVIATVKGYLPVACYVVETEAGNELPFPASKVKKLTPEAETEIWKARALAAEEKLGKQSPEDFPAKPLTIPGDDDAPYTAVCSQCEKTEDFPDEADAATDMQKAGWKFVDGNVVCPECSP